MLRARRQRTQPLPPEIFCPPGTNRAWDWSEPGQRTIRRTSTASTGAGSRPSFRTVSLPRWFRNRGNTSRTRWNLDIRMIMIGEVPWLPFRGFKVACAVFCLHDYHTGRRLENKRQKQRNNTDFCAIPAEYGNSRAGRFFRDYAAWPRRLLVRSNTAIPYSDSM